MERCFAARIRLYNEEHKIIGDVLQPGHCALQNAQLLEDLQRERSILEK
jgi:hypothetical protein